MNHLTSDELIELADGNLLAPTAAHVEECAACRAELVRWQTVMRDVKRVDVPEPSPLFWDHFSGRVRDAIAATSAPGRPTAPERLGLDVLAWSPVRWRVAGIAAALTISVLAGWFTLVGPTSHGEIGQTAALVPPAATNVGEPSIDDPSLELVAGLVDELDWDAVRVAGLSTTIGAAESAADRLTTNERRELDRLLREAIANPAETDAPVGRGREG
jgi:hypothetical protein